MDNYCLSSMNGVLLETAGEVGHRCSLSTLSVLAGKQTFPIARVMCET